MYRMLRFTPRRVAPVPRFLKFRCAQGRFGPIRGLCIEAMMRSRDTPIRTRKPWRPIIEEYRSEALVWMPILPDPGGTKQKGTMIAHDAFIATTNLW